MVLPLRAYVAGLLVLAVVASGCFGASSGPAQECLCEGLVEVAPGAFVREGLGALQVRVANEANLSVAKARVSVEGSPLFGDTDASGTVRLLNVTPGQRRVAVSTGVHQPSRVSVEVVADRLVNVSVVMLPRSDRGAGYAPHVHDLWQDRPEVVLMDRDVTLAPMPSDQQTAMRFATSQSAANLNQSWGLPLVGGLEERTIVFPGAREIEVVLSWSSTQVTLPRLGLSFTPANEWQPRHLGPKASGQAWRIPVAPEMADSGHQKYSLWTFAVYSANHPQQPTMYSPGAVLGPIHAKVTIRKGETYLEPAHLDYWAGGNVVQLRDPSKAQTVISVNPVREANSGLGLDAKMIVPPGTAKLRVEFRFAYTTQSSTQGWDYDLTWRTAAQNPHTTKLSEYGRADAQVVQGKKVWELALKAGETDAYYQTKSGWLFVPWAKPWPEEGPYVDPRSRDFFLGVWAEKDPLYDGNSA